MDVTTLGPPDPEPRTRLPMSFWDRSKLLLLFFGVWSLLVWNFYIENQVVGATLGDAVAEQGRASGIWLILFAIELVRQTHYVLSEHWAGWHQFWSQRIFGSLNRRIGKLNDWNRYRLGRLIKVLVAVALLGYVLGQIYDKAPTQALFELPQTVWSVLPLIFQLLFAVVFIVIQFGALFWFLSRGGVETYMPNDVKTRFSDVWGQDAVLERMRENLVYLEQPELIEEKGGYLPGGVLLWGPPGTGKTLMAEAVAGETGKPFVFVEPGAFVNMFMGVGILKVKSLFRKLRKLAVRYGGVVVFFDEADALGSRGALAPGGPFGGGQKTEQWGSLTGCNGLSYLTEASSSIALRGAMSASGVDVGDQGRRERFVMGGMGGGGGGGTLQSLLAEMSGLKKPRGIINRYVRRALGMRPKPPPKYRMMIMMATNMPESLDEAMLRPGRIDRIYKVGYPSKVGRIRTYAGYLSKVRHELTADEIDKLATITPYATGASIKDMINEALITAVRDDREVITWKDILRAKQLKDLGLPEDVEYIDRERHATAIHEACHAVVAYRVRRHLTIDIATIEKGGNYLGMVASIPPEDLFTRWRSEYEADILVSLASLAGERLFFAGDNSSGVSGDLEAATQVATLMEGYWGMGTTIASHGVTHRVGIGGGSGGPGGGPKNKEKDLLAQLGSRIEKNLADLYKRAERLLEENRFEILAVAHALETYKTLTGDDVKAIIDGEAGPLVDGRIYHTPGFSEAAEEYHRRALEAHDTHERVGVQLPVLLPMSFERPAAASINASPNGNGKSNGEATGQANGNGTTRRRRRTPTPSD